MRSAGGGHNSAAIIKKFGKSGRHGLGISSSAQRLVGGMPSSPPRVETDWRPRRSWQGRPSFGILAGHAPTGSRDLGRWAMARSLAER